MKAPPDPMPISMKDQGFYDEHSQSQRAIINMTLPFVQDALSTVSLPGEQAPFVIVDYGCSEGKNSVYMVSKVIENIRRRKNNQTFKIVFNDLPQNNFNRLFENIYQSPLGQSMLSASADDSKFPPVLAYVSGQPFHMQIVPAQSVHFGYSSSAAHWLTQLPAQAIRQHIYLAGADKEEKKKLGEIAAKDWQNFLNHRAAEMAPGGKLIITMAARLAEGESSDAQLKGLDDNEVIAFKSAKGPAETYTAQIIMGLINDIVQELVREKKISLAQAENLCCPIYPRSLNEVKAPLEKSPLKETFLIEHAEIVRVGCPLFKEYLQTKNSETYAQALAEMFRAFMETFLLHQLFDINERRQIIDELFNRVRSRIQSKPEYYTFFPIHSLVVLTKK